MCVHMDYKRFYGTFYGGETSEMLLLISKRLTKLISFKYNYLFKTANRVFYNYPTDSDYCHNWQNIIS